MDALGLEPGMVACACQGDGVHEYGADCCATYWAKPRRPAVQPPNPPKTMLVSIDDVAAIVFLIADTSDPRFRTASHTDEVQAIRRDHVVRMRALVARFDKAQ